MSETINSLFQETIRAHRGRTALMSKAADGGGYESITYERLGEMVRGLALGLRGLGVKKGDTVALISENRPEWVISDLAILHAGGISVALFPTLPAEQVLYSLRDSGSKAVILSNKKQLKKVEQWLGGGRGKAVIMMDGKADENSNVLSFSDVLRRGAGREGVDFSALWQSVSQADTAGIIYTSGTTGDPMGVVLTHGNFVASINAGLEAVNFKAGEKMVSFLPLNHVFARLVDHYLPLSAGASVAYAASSRDIRGVVKDMRPQYMTLVPRVLEMYRDGVMAAVSKTSPWKKWLFQMFFSAGLECCRAGDSKTRAAFIKKILWKAGDKKIFNNIRKSLGLDRLRFFISGGAPLGEDTERFFRVLGIEVLEGYGLTESAALVSVNRPGCAVSGTVGPPVKGVELDFTEEGEVLVRGANIMRGYWNRAAETARAIDSKGWLHTGDEGEVDGAGCLKIKGRLKDIIVLTTGKNVAPLPIEERLRTSPYISQILVAGDNRNSVTALIVPDFAFLRGRIKVRQGGAEPTDKEVAEDTEVKALIRGELKRLSGGLADFEQVKRFALLTRAFTVEGGELTPTLKIRRKVVFEKYGEALGSLYR